MSGLGGARRIVVKVGSSLVIDGDTGEADRAWLGAFAADVARLRARKQQVLVVSSGAVALGRRRLGLTRKALTLPEKQAAAAAGQSRLMRAWEEAFEPHAVACAQVLMTRDDTEVRRRWLNGRATVEALLTLGALPVVNENDTVVTEEIRYGDNDRLAARVAQMIGADVLVLLSDVDGLYTADPRRDAGASEPAIQALSAAAGVVAASMTVAGSPSSTAFSGSARRPSVITVAHPAAAAILAAASLVAMPPVPTPAPAFAPPAAASSSDVRWATRAMCLAAGSRLGSAV